MHSLSHVRWDNVTYICGALTSCFAMVMTFIIFVRALKRRRVQNALTKSMDTKTCKSILSGGICCANSQTYEGYNSCTSDQEDSRQAPPATSTLSGGTCTHEMITLDSSSNLPDGKRSDKMSIEAHRVVEGGEGAESMEKLERERNGKHPTLETGTPSMSLAMETGTPNMRPIMETGTPSASLTRQQMCIPASSTANNSSMPATATLRSSTLTLV